MLEVKLKLVLAVSIDEVYALEELFKGLSNKLHKVDSSVCVPDISLSPACHAIPASNAVKARIVQSELCAVLLSS